MQNRGQTTLLRKWMIVIFLFSGIPLAYSQPLLPNISVTNKNGKNYLTWSSGYEHVKQIGVQRSADSLYNYATIGYVRNPNLKTNNFTDSQPLAGTKYYKLIIVLNSGKYFFTHPAKVVIDSSTVSVTPPVVAAPVTAATPIPKPAPPNVFRPSVYVYTNPDGNVNINLADAADKHYHIWFFDSSGVKIFSVDKIPESFLTIDKSSFLHSGWFHYELFEGEKLKEKSKFYIPAALKDDPKPNPKKRFRRR